MACIPALDIRHNAPPTTLYALTEIDGAIEPTEIIEERRKDADGRILVYKYSKGKLLGKVR